jgi:hypothetical protein
MMKTMWTLKSTFLLIAFVSLAAVAVTHSDELVHLRGGGELREWDSFPADDVPDAVRITLPGMKTPGEACLTIRQLDVRHQWRVRFNGHALGRLTAEEDPLIALFDLKSNMVRADANVLEIAFEKGRDVDDILVGDAKLHPLSRSAYTSEASLSIRVTERGKPVPARLTLLDAQGCRVPLGLTSSDRLAVRAGVVYTLDGLAKVPCPAGEYTVYASRGFEYSRDSAQVKISPRRQAAVELEIVHEVPTPNLVSCDPHVHTVTFSGHGDCTLTERMLTLAGEQVQCPIATDHNVHIDYRKEQTRLGVTHFTSMVGNEYTTSTGHFNLFPMDPDRKPPSYIGNDWSKVMAAIAETGAPVRILNHARDIHRSYRPFDPAHHIAVTGESTTGLDYAFNAMEVLNSGAILNDPMRLVHDWFGLLNRGLNVAAVGTSDSHDVANYIVGQGRTYVPVLDESGWQTAEIVKGMQAGQTHVSYGLLTTLQVERTSTELSLHIRVLGPSWSPGGDVRLFMNGQEVFKAPAHDSGVVKYDQVVRLPNPGYDVWFVAVASGPGVSDNVWPCAKPYQRLNDQYAAYFLGLSPAVRVDSDQDGEWRSPFASAQLLVKQHAGNPGKAIQACARYDAAVAAQLASVLVQASVDPALLVSDVAMVQQGLQAFVQAWELSQKAGSASSLFPAP